MKKIILSVVTLSLASALAFSEPDSGDFIPSESATASHIYLEAQGAIVFPAYSFDAGKSLTESSGGFAVGAGYNWGGWLLGLAYTRDYFGKAKHDGGFGNIKNNIFSLQLRRLLSKNTLSFLPTWLEIVPGISGGLNCFTASDIDFGDALAPFWNASLELAFVPDTERAVPYIGFDYNMFHNSKYCNGIMAYPRATVGFRIYPFGKDSKPVGTVVTKFSPQKGFTPDGNGVNDTIDIKTSTKNLKESPESWKVEVLDQQKGLLKTWTGKGDIPQLTWDGKTDNGDKLFSSETYTVRTTINPSAGDKARLGDEAVTGTASFKTGVLMEEIIPQKQWKIVVNTIYFDANAASFDTLTDAQKEANKETLDSIAKQALALSQDIQVEVQGYANNVSNTEEENIKELIPLSQERAESIKKQLKHRGLKKDNITAIGKGGENPLAAWEDRAHWWKNRRVEFIVTK